MHETSSERPPANLSPAARHWWRSLTQEFDISDAHGRFLLECGLRAFDRCEAARRCVDRQGAVLKDRFGKPVRNPAVTVEKDSRAAMLQAFKALNLDASPLPGRGKPLGGAGPGKPLRARP